MKVLESLDRAKNLREIKLLYTTIYESFSGVNFRNSTQKSLKESFASKPTGTNAKKQEVIKEQVAKINKQISRSNDIVDPDSADRFRKLAGIKIKK
jgi:hypothetical protein